MSPGGCDNVAPVTASLGVHHARVWSATSAARSSVLSAGQVLGSLAVAGAVAAGALIAEPGCPAARGRQDWPRHSACWVRRSWLLPLARLALSKGRRVSLAFGYGIGAIGSLIVISGAVWRLLPVVFAGTLLVGVATASGLQARYAATDLATEETRGRSLSIVVWAGTIGAVAGPNLLEVSGHLGVALGLPQLAGPYVVGFLALAGAALVLGIFLRPDPYLLARSARAAKDPVAAAEIAHPRLRDGIAHIRGNRHGDSGYLHHRDRPRRDGGRDGDDAGPYGACGCDPAVDRTGDQRPCRRDVCAVTARRLGG